ncbi:chorismate dehydratase [Bacteroidia bacterium]|nr:chorismate dehydratase [Bacteroidia bacterium]
MNCQLSIVNYLNAAPFLYGLQRAVGDGLRLKLQTPADCAASFFAGAADVALVPVGALLGQDDYRVVTNFCIGAVRRVHTVCLFAGEPLERLHTIYLDIHSRTSVLLMQILAKEFWQIHPKFLPSRGDVYLPAAGVGYVLIGDKAFEAHHRFAQVYDLAQAWHTHTGLPFVFALWLSQKHVDTGCIAVIDEALRYGAAHLREVIGEQEQRYAGVDVAHYLTQNIDYRYDAPKQKAVQLFLKKCKSL